MEPMDTILFSQFEPLLRTLDAQALEAEIRQPNRLLIEAGTHRGKRLEVAYAPFNHVTPGARIVIVGITPGRVQMRNALLEAQRQLHAGRSTTEALAAAKVFASFSGPMRANLVAMLDDIGVHALLGLPTTGALWNGAADRVHFTSALRYPVFVDGQNYGGQPSMLTTPLLREQLERWLVAEMRQLPDAVFVPLGPKVAEALEHAAPLAGLSRAQVLAGLPHPSGASGERIAYFLGRKRREALSSKTNPVKIDQARAALVEKIGSLSRR